MRTLKKRESKDVPIFSPSVEITNFVDKFKETDIIRKCAENETERNRENDHDVGGMV